MITDAFHLLNSKPNASENHLIRLSGAYMPW